MAKGHKIQWTDATWNPIAGCSVRSPGCTNCYAMRQAARLERMGNEKYKGLTKIVNGNPVWTGEVRIDRNSLYLPRTWIKPRKIFVNSMSDLFHEDLDFQNIHEVFRAMIEAPQHTYQILTKRPLKMLEFSKRLDPSYSWGDDQIAFFQSNLWFGTSIEDQVRKSRIEILRQITGVAVKFLSIEPLLEDLGDLDLRGIDWIIIGGESGPNARPINADWVRAIRDQCIAQSVPFFFKQWGQTSRTRNAMGVTEYLLDGREWHEFPRIGGTV